MSFLSGIASTAQASQQVAVSGLKLQSSAYGKVIPIVYGTTRVAPNLIWYGDFVAIAQSSSSGGGGGKGGATGGGGGKSGNSGTSYLYQTAVAFGFCEGPINAIGKVYVNKSVTNIASLGLSQFTGGYGQSPWGYMTTAHPAQAIGYSGVAYLAASSYQLGNNAELPNHNCEVSGIYSTSLATLGVVDADPSLVIADLLSNPHYGAGLPLSRIGSLSVYQSYCIASGLWISPAYTTQSQASSILDDIAKSTNSAFVWSSGVLTIVPYGDQSITANGYSYAAPSAPLYDLGDDDFMPNRAASAGSKSDSIILERKRPSDKLNSLKIECLDRRNSYNPAVIEAKDQALIEQFGLRQSTSTQMHMFADMQAARTSAQLQLQRHYIRNVYHFTLDQRYVLLDPMDIVTVLSKVPSFT